MTDRQIDNERQMLRRKTGRGLLMLCAWRQTDCSRQPSQQLDRHFGRFIYSPSCYSLGTQTNAARVHWRCAANMQIL